MILKYHMSHATCSSLKNECLLKTLKISNEEEVSTLTVDHLVSCSHHMMPLGIGMVETIHESLHPLRGRSTKDP